MRFLDEAVVTVRSGNGGRGCVSFRKEKYIPQGGPDGGDGGDGGSIKVRASSRLRTLIQYNSRKFFKAPNGAPGRGKNQTGKNGRDIVLEVPTGTVVADQETGEVLADLVRDGEEFLVLPGGRGGKGNQHFATPTQRAPRFAQPGEPGREMRLRFSLKSLADIGIIGLPNAGKSTLLSRLTTAHPRIDDYPFSTLVPNLGVLELEDHAPLTIADIPGLIEGASQGRGLGHRFLKHIERTQLLLHVIDISAHSPDGILESFMILKHELEAYDPALLRKAQMVLINKIDLLGSCRRDLLERTGKALSRAGFEFLAISALTGEGIDALKEILSKKF